MDADRHSPIDFESRVFLLAWCLLVGLALAPMPALHALPSAFFYYLVDSPQPGWTRLSLSEAYWFTLFGVSLAPIFLAWSLPGTGRPGLPKRSIVVLCLLVAYNPLRHYIESNFYGDVVANITASFSVEPPLIWSIRHLDTPLLIGLAATALLRRHELQARQKILFHWILFVCALWAAGPLYDVWFYWILTLSAFAQ